MAKDVIFDSERQEIRQKRRRYLIPAAVILGAVIAAAVIALIVRGSRGKANTGGTDTSYPYSWAEGRNGVIVLELDRTAAPGYLWYAEKTDGQMSVAAQQDPAGITRFTLTPKAAGRSVLEFILCREGDEQDRIYEISALAEVTEAGRSLHSALISISGQPHMGVIRGGEGTACPYTVRVDEDGDLQITVTDNTPAAEAEGDGEEENKDGDWSCVSEDESVLEFLGVITAENTATAYLRPGAEAGQTMIRMRNLVSGAVLTLEVESDGSGSLRLLSHSLQTEDAPAASAG